MGFLVASRRRLVGIGAIAALATALVIGILSSNPAEAATLAVDCDAAGDLQATIDVADTGDTVEVTGTCTGNFTVDKNLNIQGVGATPTLSGTATTGPVLSVGTVVPGVSVTIEGMEISGANSTASGGGLLVTASTVSVIGVLFDANSTTGSGGGIYATASTITVDSVNFTNNTAGVSGGAILNTGGALTVDDSTFTSNVAEGTTDDGGGGVATLAGGTSTISDSGFYFNSALTPLGFGAPGGWGGAIHARFSTVTINRSVLTGNEAERGGAIGNAFTATVYLNDSTISNNIAKTGGGIWNDTAASTYADGSTITDNTATISGGGIKRWPGTAINIHFTGSILSGNTSPSGPDCSGSINAVLEAIDVAEYSVIGDVTDCPIVASVGNQIGVDPLLSPLATNGGFGATHAIAAASPARNLNMVCAGGFDQRGVPRVADSCDAGSFEADIPLSSPWIESGSGSTSGCATTSTQTVLADGTTGPARFRYVLPDSPCNHSGVGTWFFETTAEYTGVVTLDWHWAGFHAFFLVDADLDAFTETGAVTSYTSLIANPGTATCGACNPPSAGFSYVGSVALEVSVGDDYGFRMSGSNSDGLAEVSGTLTLEGFGAAASADPASVAQGDDTTVTVDVSATGNAQTITSIVATLNADLSYVPGSSTVDTYAGSAPIADPSVLGDVLTWSPPGGFTKDAVGGLSLTFDVAVSPTTVPGPTLIQTVTSSGGYATAANTSPTVVFAPAGPTALAQAVILGGGSQTGIVGQVTAPPGVSGPMTFSHDTSCSDGDLSGSSIVLGTFPIVMEPDGELFFALAITNSQPITGGFITGKFGIGAESECIAVGPNNDNWTRALDVPLTPGAPGTTAGSSSGVVDALGVSRWYKFSIQPGAKATVTLSGLPADYDLAVYKDIGQAYEDLTDTTESLTRLSAEFAPSIFSPGKFSPSIFSPSIFSPDAYAPSIFSPSIFSPSIFSPSIFSPSIFSPSTYSPSIFSPSIFSPSIFSPSIFSPSIFSPSIFSPSIFSPSIFSPSIFSADDFSSAETRSIIGVSALTGTGSEVVVANTWSNTGEFYVRVTGRNGVFDATTPFAIDVELEGQTCDLAGFVYPTARSDVPTSADSVIVWDSSRISGTPAEIATLAARLTALAARPEVDGVIVDLAPDTQLNALRSQAAANTGCVYATNLVADQIKEIVDSHRNPDLRFVTLVGGDDAVPFFRYPDQALLGPEQDYDPPVADNSVSQTSLRLNYFLGQDEYGSRLSISQGDGDIPIPDLAVGRLVETAAEATTVLDAYLGTGAGVVGSSSSLVTGYDFLSDAADAVKSNLDAGTGLAGQALIDAATVSPELGWTADDLRTALFDSGRHDLVYLAGHFSANSALAADYETSVITTELADSNVDLLNSIVFSGGCHSGYSIVDGEVVPGVTLPLDWAQAFAQKGATLVAGTGYQYGDTDFVEYSERLYADFSAQLRTGTGAVSVGEALVKAKQGYLANTPDMRGLHRKSVIIATVFGLPMISVDMQGTRLTVSAAASIVPGTTPFASGPGGPATADGLALEFADISLGGPFPIAPQTVVLKTLPTPLPANPVPGDFVDLTTTYYEGPDGAVVTNPAEPVIPLISENVSVVGQVLRGVGFRGGSYTDMPGIVPLTGAPTTELRGVHTPFVSEVFFPLRLATVNYFGELGDGTGTRLNVTPAQHRVAQVGDIESILRLYGDLDLRLYYSDNTETYGDATPALAAAPTITDVTATVVGGDVVFSAGVAGDPSAGVQEVWVTYTDETSGSPAWMALDLIQSATDSTLWTGTLTGGASLGSLEYIVQAVNGVGLVGITDNFGSYFEVVTTGITAAPDPTTLLVVPGAPSGVHGTSVSATATLTSDGLPVAGARVFFSLSGANAVGTTDVSGIATATLSLLGEPGPSTLTASFAATDTLEGSGSDAPFTILKTPTSLSITPGVAQQPGGLSGLTATLVDAAGNPIKERTVYFVVDGGLPLPVITTFAGLASLPSLDLPAGTYPVTAYFLGNVPGRAGTLVDPIYLSTSTSGGTVTIADVDPPVVTVPGDITLEATVTSGAPHTFTATASDVVDGALTPTCTPASGSTFALGATTVTCDATDAAGNTGDASFTVTVEDTTDPVVTAPPNADALSPTAAGIAVSYGTATVTDIADPLVTVTCLPASGSVFGLGSTTVTCTATDASGNTGIDTLTVTVQLDTDGDGIPNTIDTDDDNDGQLDVDELTCGSDPIDDASLSPDLDADSIPDCVDTATDMLLVKRSLIDRLEALRSGASRRDRFRLLKAQIQLKLSVFEWLWVPGSTSELDPRRGYRVFNHEAKAAHELDKLIDKGSPVASDAQEIIDILVEGDRRLAAEQIERAIAQGGNPKEIAKAERDLVKGDSYAARRPYSAIKKYKNAWKHAQKALR